MSHLVTKYTRLKKMVGGNREKVHYEETFGMPQEEFYKITMPNSWNRRILAEIEFAIRLSQELGGKYDTEVEGALDFLQGRMDQEGVLTKEACMKAEEVLLPLQKDAKEYRLILAAHAHIDMNWMWGWQETVASTIATFQTMLKLMEEYPEFCFSQSQAAVYKIIEDYAPELKPEMEKRMQEGRWEVTAAAWVETDKNMPSTESLLNHIAYTRKYLHEHWGIDPATLDLDFSPDTFGHSAHLPELNSFGHVKYYYHCRGLDGKNALYRWRAPSGKEVLVYREQYWYNSGITPLPAIGIIDVAKRSGGLKTGLVVYGVGDHGGGPTRRDLERASEMQQWPVFPQIQFGTFHDYFREAEKVREKLEVIDHELNFIFPGCYTTQSRLKMGNRHSEAALFDAQSWNALACHTLDVPYSEKQYESAWQSVLFTHFHDILTGSCVQESREHAMGQFAHGMAIANTRASRSLEEIAKSIDTSGIYEEEDMESQSEGAGVGYGLSSFTGIPAPERGRGKTRIFHIFNSSSSIQERCCEITVWDWIGDMRNISVVDDGGKPLSFQLLDRELKQYWDHKYFRILVKTPVPAYGYTTIVLREEEPDEYRIYYQSEERSNKPYQNIVLENSYLRAEFEYQNGDLISLIDKKTGKEMLLPGETGGLRYVLTERDSSSAWQIGRYIKMFDDFETVKLSKMEGELRKGFEMEQRIRNSVAKTTVSLEENAQTLTIRYHLDWHEISRNGEPVPVLVYHLPLAETKTFLYDVPGGSQYRPPMEMDVPGLQYGAAVYEDNRAVVMVTDSKYGYRGYAGGLIATLINATTNPDPYPERGIHDIVLHVGVDTACPKSLEELAFGCNHPLLYQSGTVHGGKLPLSGGLMHFESETAVVSGVFCQDEGLVVRVNEICGESTKVTMTLMEPFSKAMGIDLLGEAIEEMVVVDGDTLTFDMKPYTIGMIKVLK